MNKSTKKLILSRTKTNGSTKRQSLIENNKRFKLINKLGRNKKRRKRRMSLR